ncbi:MAG: HDOD domain-containing protein [Planctomycetota bacterium]
MEPRRRQPNVLFVDDDLEHLRGLEAAMAPRDDEWRIEYLADPTLVRELLAQRELDVVVADLDMPGIDGPGVLEMVRSMQPQAVRIVLTGEGHESELLRALPFAHQWLTKPCPPELLRAAVERAIVSGTFVHREDLRAILGHTQALPSVPHLFAEVALLIADDDVDLQRVTAVVERDPAMAAKVLQLANCTFYRPERPLLSLREAVIRIGMRTLSNCVLAAELFSAMPRDDRQTRLLVDGIERRAMLQTRLLTHWCEEAVMLGPDVRELLPTCGLLHEVGALVLLQFDPLSHRTTHRLAQRHRLSLEALERRMIGASHAQIAASLLGSWGLPWPIVDLMANHHDPDRSHAGTDPCAMLAAAEVFVSTPWLVPDFEQRAVQNGWGFEFARWTDVAGQLLRR